MTKYILIYVLVFIYALFLFLAVRAELVGRNKLAGWWYVVGFVVLIGLTGAGMWFGFFKQG